MRNILFLVISVLFIEGCSSGIKRLELEPYAKLSIPSISLNAPSNFPKDKWITYGDSLYDSGNVIQLFRHLPNMMSEEVRITVYVPETRINIDYLLDKKDSDDLERLTHLPPSEHNKKNMEERGVAYNRDYVDFIGGLKCVTDVESSSPAQGVGFKKYYTVCGYYDTNGNKKRVDIMYHYISSFNGTKFQSDTTSTITSGKDIDALFKQDMKAIFDSLVIHDMDRERMSKNGLLPNKKYEIQEW